MAAGDVQVTIVGNIGGDPELRFTGSGDAVASFNVAVTPRTLDKATNEWKDGEASWYRCTAWRDMAEHVAESLQRGMRVIVTGRLRIRKYEKDGVEKSTVEVTIDEVGPSLKYATAQVKKSNRQGGASGGGQGGQAGQAASFPDPWASGGFKAPAGATSGGGSAFSDEPPF